MTVPKEAILDLVDDLPDEKLGTVASFIRFLEEMDEANFFEPYSEEKTLRILQEDERYLRSRQKA